MSAVANVVNASATGKMVEPIHVVTHPCFLLGVKDFIKGLDYPRDVVRHLDDHHIIDPEKFAGGGLYYERGRLFGAIYGMDGYALIGRFLEANQSVAKSYERMTSWRQLSRMIVGSIQDGTIR